MKKKNKLQCRISELLTFFNNYNAYEIEVALLLFEYCDSNNNLDINKIFDIFQIVQDCDDVFDCGLKETVDNILGEE